MIAPLLHAITLFAPQEPTTVAIQVPKTETLARATLLADRLVLVGKDDAGDRRVLRSYERPADGAPFASQPSGAPFTLLPDVIAIAFADVDRTPGRELVLFTAERAVAATFASDGTPSYAPLFAHRLLWSAAARDGVVLLDRAVVDIDGDGRDDLVVPEADGARLVRQVRTGDAVQWLATEWRLPARMSALATVGTQNGPARIDQNELSLRLDFDSDGDGRDDGSDGARARGPLLQLRAEAPPFAFADLDGDGHRDALALRNGSLWVWPIGTDGAIPPIATERVLPLPGDRLTLFDPAFDVQLEDLDGDGRSDLLLTTSAQRDGAVEVRIDLFCQQADGSWAKPSRLRMQTLAEAPQLVDVDGDGKRDLVAVTMRTDLLGKLTGGSTTIEMQLNVFRGLGNRFAMPAMLQKQLQVATAGEGTRRPLVRVVPAGNGAGLLVADAAGLRLAPLARDGDGMAVAAEAWRVPLAAAGNVQPPTAGARELVVRQPHEVLYVRWQ